MSDYFVFSSSRLYDLHSIASFVIQFEMLCVRAYWLPDWFCNCWIMVYK